MMAIDARAGSSSPLAARIRAQLAALQATVPSTTGYQPVNKPGAGFACGGFEATVSATGALVGLRSSASDANWAAADRPLGQFKYQTYGPEDYDRFLAQYVCYLLAVSVQRGLVAPDDDDDVYTLCVCVCVFRQVPVLLATTSGTRVVLL